MLHKYKLSLILKLYSRLGVRQSLVVESTDVGVRLSWVEILVDILIVTAQNSLCELLWIRIMVPPSQAVEKKFVGKHST